MMQPDVVLGFVASLRAMSPEQLRHISKISEFSLRRATDLYQFAESAMTPAAVALRLVRADTHGLAVIVESPQDISSASSTTSDGLRNLGLLYQQDDHEAVLPQAVSLAHKLPKNDVAEPTKVTHLSTIQSLQLADDFLLTLEDGPLPLSRSGTVSAAPTRQLHDDFDVSAAPVNALASLLLKAGLITEVGQSIVLLPQEFSDRWLPSSPTQRRQLLVAAWSEFLPTALQSAIALAPNTSLAKASITTIINSVFPFDSHWRTKLTDLAVHSAATLGAGSHPPVPVDGLTDIEKVIIQPDGSVIAPGLLSPNARRVVAAFTRVEHIDIASTFRIDSGATATTLARQASINMATATTDIDDAKHTDADTSSSTMTTSDAMAAAQATLIEKITEHSETPPPDALLRRISDTAARLSELSLQASTAPAIGQSQFGKLQPITIIRTATPALANELQNDRLLTECRLDRTGETELTAQRDITAVHNVLVERRYLPPLRERRRTPPIDADASQPDDSLELASALIDNLDTVNTVEGRLHLALRYRLSTSITVSGRNGTERTLLVRPLSLANGRLVAVDDDAEVERTVPIAHIVSVVPLEPSEARA